MTKNREEIQAEIDYLTRKVRVSESHLNNVVELKDHYKAEIASLDEEVAKRTFEVDYLNDRIQKLIDNLND